MGPDNVGGKTEKKERVRLGIQDVLISCKIKSIFPFFSLINYI
jgi:hypothetical protein